MNTLRAATIVMLFLLAANCARAQDTFDTAQSAAVSQNPANVTCTLSLPDGRTTFQQGEAIRVTLSFTTSTPGRYRYNPYWFDPLDTLHISPGGSVTDPRAEERGGPVSITINGYIPPPVPLTDKPAVMPIILNNRLRFDHPGTFRLYVTSQRILDAATHTGKFPNIGPFAVGKPVTSNIVTFTVTPASDAWAHAQVQAALAQKPVNLSVLSYLGTREAAQALLAVLATDKYPRSSESNGYAIHQGLVGFPDRAWLIEEMQHDLTAPDYTLTQTFLDTLAQLESQRKTDTPFRRRDWLRAADAVPAKTPAALPMTLHTLLETTWLTDIGTDPDVRARLPSLTHRMAPVFDQLPPQAQEYLLDGDWRRMRTPALLPALRRAWAAATRPQNNDFGLNDLLLRRLYDLSPAEGRRAILREAVQPYPRVTARALSILPDRTLPALDKPLLANLYQQDADQDIVCGLIARYASPALYGPARAFYGTGEDWACAPKAALLAYFLRVKPDDGAAMVRQALTQRTKTGCYSFLLTDIWPLYDSPRLEPIAISHLNYPNAQVVSDAAEALGQYGSRRAEPALRARLARTGDSAKFREQMEWHLVDAITKGQNWYESPSQLRQIRALCVNDNRRQEIDQDIADNYPHQVHVDYELPSDEEYWTIGPYNGQGRALFQAKMAQFPRGTVFLWQDIGFGPDNERVFTQSRTFAHTHGMTLIRWQSKAQP